MPSNLGEILAAIRPPGSFYEKIPAKLKKLAEDHGCEFVEGKAEWGLDNFVRPGKRTFFGSVDST
jgi:hypothetical protein